MAKNDTILIDTLLQHHAAKNPTEQLSDVFEKFVMDQVLKNFDLTNEELNYGWVDGALDGGIDGFYVLVNGRLVTEASDFSWPRSGAEIQVYLITCKHQATFSQAPLDALLATVQDIFDLDRTNAELVGKYSPGIKKSRDAFAAAFRNLSLGRPSLSFNLIYASRGDATKLGESVAARAQQLTDLFQSYFSASTATFVPLGSTELVEMYREIRTFALDLPVQESLTAGQEGYVVLTSLHDYSSFVQDEKGQLRRYLFDSNVRAYLGENLVNDDITQTLANRDSPNFWWLNNGVTILATSASLVGKILKLKDIQIVNGLQTTESIHRFFSIKNNVPPLEDKRSLLVKVIVSQEENIRDQVIRATNNQSTVEPAALHATDRIQRDIEDILLRYEWYYERRTNHYKNEDRPDARIISPLLIATGAVALLLKNPIKSSKFRQKILRSPEAYHLVYSEHFPLDVWPVVAALMRGSESSILRTKTVNRAILQKRVSAWRGVLSYFAAARLTGSCAFTHQCLISLDVNKLTDEFMDECWTEMFKAIANPNAPKANETHIMNIAQVFKTRWMVNGHPADGLRAIPEPTNGSSFHRTASEEFLKMVYDALPVQPWMTGVHHQVAKALNIKPSRASKAIQILMDRGSVYRQIDGIVYDDDGHEVSRDEAR
ncbi:AIPR family protein [Herminiimonas arsenitoxidans]|uniref:AIPR family protein n=1 Tax=Herminiimonas arsenitoxidans TaxID=1809410 RepID=UPI000971167B|nr:AIPR family protein [Herminiimonas arsenitoxidans]